MRYSILDKEGNIINTVIADEIFVKSNFEFYKLVDEETTIASIVVPQSITVRQAREQLIRVGLLSKVQSEIDKITDISQREIVQNYWEYSMDFKRDNDVLISLAYSLGLSDADIDNLFIEASKL